jgi:hypothetical protein
MHSRLPILASIASALSALAAGILSMTRANAGKWDVKGWIDKDHYLALVEKNGYELRYQDATLILVRVPQTVGRDLAWGVLEKVQRCTTNDWWLSVTKSERTLKSVMTERLGIEFVRVVIAGLEPQGD